MSRHGACEGCVLGEIVRKNVHTSRPAGRDPFAIFPRPTMPKGPFGKINPFVTLHPPRRTSAKFSGKLRAQDNMSAKGQVGDRVAVHAGGSRYKTRRAGRGVHVD